MRSPAGAEQRQAVLLQARDREAQRNVQQAGDARREAGDARRDADASQLRVDSLEAQLADLKVQKTERGLVLTLGDVLFDTNQSTLKASSHGTLDRLAMALREKSGRKVVIEGHTDNVGSDETNQGLSGASRAVSAGRLDTTGCGAGPDHRDRQR